MKDSIRKDKAMGDKGATTVERSSTAARSEFYVGVSTKYRLMRKIGSGSFGDIYLAVNITNGEEVAVKLASKKLLAGKKHAAFAGRVERQFSLVPVRGAPRLALQHVSCRPCAFAMLSACAWRQSG